MPIIMRALHSNLCLSRLDTTGDRTGNTAFHGDQDNDPNMNADCRAGSPPTFLPRGNDVRVAELQVYSSDHRVSGATLVRDEHGDDGHGQGG
jgi:hypothetical protein